MTTPRAKVPRWPTAVLEGARAAAARLAALSKDPRVRAEALNVAQALQQLMQAIKSGQR